MNTQFHIDATYEYGNWGKTHEKAYDKFPWKVKNFTSALAENNEQAVVLLAPKYR
ncbi:hypothetical protein M378DRAFT_18207 [Amanita muscaria Koide BX008]|uniref:Uncharacterized protein n=1 Tax=Amanita muscaria (strain Koide BX008) TaxID=946122 RepID=A0A0C2WEY5_AMAMK|nr:hypothetical protein M378DRAFT_18207 [Amanita muscaria Koide BX008]